jgi:hypothetical protein
MPISAPDGGTFGSQEANWKALEELVQAERARDPRLSLERARANVYATEQGRRYLAAMRAAAKAAQPTAEQTAERKSQAWSKIEAAAETLRKGDSSLSLEKARSIVMAQRPDLVASYRGDTPGGGTIGAPPAESAWLRQLEVSKSERSIRDLAEDRLAELTKAEQSRNETLIKLDPTVKRLTREQAFVVAVQSPEGKEAYEQLRRPDADLSPLQIRQAEDDRYARLMQSLERQINPAPAPVVPPSPTPVAKQATAVVEEPAKTWVSKADSGSGARKLRILLEPGGSAEDIQKAMLEAPESIRFVRDTVFHGREVKAGQVVGIWPADDVAA